MYTKTHQIAPFKKNFSGGACPQTPLAKRIPNLKKKFLPPPPLPNPGDPPAQK